MKTCDYCENSASISLASSDDEINICDECFYEVDVATDEPEPVDSFMQNMAAIYA